MTFHVVDPLTEINGIGPACQEELRRSGVYRYSQLAEMTPADIAARLTAVKGINATRIQHENWIGQARQLAGGDNSQQYATYTIQLLLDADKTVRRTKVAHVQSQKEEAWAGWQVEPMLSFIQTQAGLTLPVEPKSLLPDEIEPPVVAPVLSGEVAVRQIAIMPDPTGGLRQMHIGQRPFTLTATIDSSQVAYTGTRPLQFELVYLAKNLQNGQRQELGREVLLGAFEMERQLQVRPLHLASGVYRLEARLRVSAGQHQLEATGEGELLQIV